MENKNSYLKAFIENNGELNEMDLGEKMGLHDTETREIIVQLLSEHKIEYVENGASNYRLLKTSKKKNNKTLN